MGGGTPPKCCIYKQKSTVPLWVSDVILSPHETPRGTRFGTKSRATLRAASIPPIVYPTKLRFYRAQHLLFKRSNCGSIVHTIYYPMPTAVPATVPPSPLCTKFVLPIVLRLPTMSFSCFRYSVSQTPAITTGGEGEGRGGTPGMFGFLFSTRPRASLAVVEFVVVFGAIWLSLGCFWRQFR